MGDAILVLIYSLEALGMPTGPSTADLINKVKESYYEYRNESNGSTRNNSGLAKQTLVCTSGDANPVAKDSYETESRSGNCNATE